MILTTGATGQLGFEVVRLVRARDLRALHLVRDPSRLRPELDVKQHLIQADLTGSYELPKPVTHVIHLAGCTEHANRRELKVMHHAHLSLARRAAALPGLKRFTLASTCYPAETSPYDEDKKLLEAEISEILGDKLLVLRLPPLMGTARRGLAGHLDFVWVLALADRVGVAPLDRDARLDVAPLDHVAALAVQLTLDERKLLPLYDVCVGSQSPSWYQVYRSAQLTCDVDEVPEELLRGPLKLDDAGVKLYERVRGVFKKQLADPLVFDDTSLRDLVGSRVPPLDQYADRLIRESRKVPFIDLLRAHARG